MLRPVPGGSYEPQRFLREIRIAARLAHPQILPLHDSGEIEPERPGGPRLLYFVMPYAGCESLRDRLARDGQLPVDVALRITRAVAAALSYAHRHGSRSTATSSPRTSCSRRASRSSPTSGSPPRSPRPAGDSVYVTDHGFAVGHAGLHESRAGERGAGARRPLRPVQPGLRALRDARRRAAVRRHRRARHHGAPRHRGPGPDPAPAGPTCRPRSSAPWPARSPRSRASAFPAMPEFADALVAPVPEIIPAAAPGTAREARTIAVLPFVNASGDAENEYLSDGITDELIHRPRQGRGAQRGVPHLGVRAQGAARRTCGTSAPGSACPPCSRAPCAGPATGSGSRPSSSGVAEGRTLWSERYDRELEDVFDIQDEIARTIVTTLRSTLLRDLGDAPPVRYTANLTAYHLYLKGRYWWNRRTQSAIAEGIKYFERAIEEDAGYALAYTGLADSYALQVDYRGAPVREGMERARELARRALELDDSLAEAHTSLAWVTFIYDWDWPAAAAQFRRAIELNPSYSVARQWHSWFLIAMGRTEAALAEGRMRRGAGSRPRSRSAAAWAGCTTTPGSRRRRWSTSAAPWR